MKNKHDKQMADEKNEDYYQLKLKKSLQGFALIFSVMLASAVLCLILSALGIIEISK
jgi:hypothetical protein